jgi:hypothetical protein
MRAEYSPAAQPGVVTLRMDACGFFVERRFGIELNINPVEMALVEFPPLDGTRPTILENAGFSRPGVGFKSPLSHFGYGADGSNSSILPMTGCIPRSRALARVCCHRST